MKQIHASLLLAASIIGIALLTVAGIVPQEAAQIAPFLLLALFPGAWLHRDRSCSLLKRVRP